jgi:hypothetical protein
MLKLLNGFFFIKSRFFCGCCITNDKGRKLKELLNKNESKLTCSFCLRTFFVTGSENRVRFPFENLMVV